MSNVDEEIRAAQAARKAEMAADEGIGLGQAGVYDSDIYGGASMPEKGTEMPLSDDEDDATANHPSTLARKAASGPPGLPDDDMGRDDDPMAQYRETHGSGFANTRIADRHAKDSYKARAMARRAGAELSPSRGDAFSGKTPARSYAQVMKDRLAEEEEAAVRAALLEKMQAKHGAGADGAGKRARPSDAGAPPAADAPPAAKQRRSRWDQTPVAPSGNGHGNGHGAGAGAGASSAAAAAAAAAAELTRTATAVAEAGAVADAASASASAAAAARKSRWDQTPSATPVAAGGALAATPGATPSRKRSRWDETPGATPMVGAGATPMATPGATPVGGAGYGMGATPMGLTPGAARRLRLEREMLNRNRPLTDEDLDAMFPMDGYVVLEPPPGYAPAVTASARLAATPTPLAGTPGFAFQSTPAGGALAELEPEVVDASLPGLKPEDMKFFGRLTEEVDEEALPVEEMKERKILKLLLRIKNGAPPMRKSAMRQITEKAREFGADALFNLILPILMSGDGLEDQERHLLVKVVDRVLYRLGDLVRPFVHKILVVVEPLLIEDDYYARVEGREIISNLAKAAGLATMISTMRPDIDNADEYMRNMTARAFAVVASALGVQALLPFLRAACKSRKSWQARHTGVKIVQRIAILMGCSVLPHLRALVDCVAPCLEDENQKVRTVTALALAALAEAACPYGVEAFGGVLSKLWKATRQHRGKGLAALLKACGFIIPLMAAEDAAQYVKDLMPVVIREFQNPDEEVKRIVLKVVEQCIMNEGVDVDYVRAEILPPFFRHFWVRRMAADRENSKQLVLTTEQIGNKVGSLDILARIVDDLKDDAEPYRRMVMETVERVILNLGTGSVDEDLEKRLMDGVLFAFQEQTGEDTTVMLSGFGTVVNALGTRVQALLPQIIPMIQWRLNNKAPKVRMQAADLVGRIAPVMQRCGEEERLSRLGVMMYEYLGEEYPEVLGSVLGGLKAVVNVIGMDAMQPPISELLPRLTPILRNRNEKVQENVIDLIGRIADRGPEHVPPREWMRICFELLELLKAQRKSIRRATVNTFGYIAKAINPQDVIHTLLNNLRVQERQSRVCTTVAIAIVAETCFPFMVIPHLMNEYRTRDMNVQNGVLKATSFMFEYIGILGKDYIYAVLPMLEDALVERDRVHRQTACNVVKHLSCGITGMGCEDAFQHLLNFVWPNIFETSPHVAQAVMEAIEGLRVALGPTKILQYALQGLFHPARRVREKYWNVYNNLYVYTADAMTPALPRVEDDANNTYTRHYLDMML